MHCIFCNDWVEDWYQWRWRGVYQGPVCQACWDEEYPVPGYSPDHQGGADHPEEISPAFHIMRMRRIRNG